MGWVLVLADNQSFSIGIKNWYCAISKYYPEKYACTTSIFVTFTINGSKIKSLIWKRSNRSDHKHYSHTQYGQMFGDT